MTIENLPSVLPSSHKPSPWTKVRQLSLRSGIPLVKNDTSPLLLCTIEMPTVQWLYMILHKQYGVHIRTCQIHRFELEN
jgi:hypothetical protein